MTMGIVKFQDAVKDSPGGARAEIQSHDIQSVMGI
jgi:hypothetical protein